MSDLSDLSDMEISGGISRLRNRASGSPTSRVKGDTGGESDNPYNPYNCYILTTNITHTTNIIHSIHTTNTTTPTTYGRSSLSYTTTYGIYPC